MYLVRLGVRQTLTKCGRGVPDKHGLLLRARILFRRRHDARPSETPRLHVAQGCRVGVCAPGVRLPISRSNFTDDG